MEKGEGADGVKGRGGLKVLKMGDKNGNKNGYIAKYGGRGSGMEWKME